MAWSAGRMAGQAVLDGIRAAESFAPSEVDASSKVAGWGYSGGGQATGWAAQLQPSYAPELNVVGWVAGDFAADLKSLIAPGGNLDGTALSGIEMTAVVGVARDYPQLLPLFNAAGQQMAAGIKDACQAQAFISNPFTSLSQFTNVNPLTNSVTLSVLADDSVGAAAPTAPTLLQSGQNDEIIPPAQGTYANAVWCAKGGNIQLQRSEVPEHVVNDFALIPGSVQWLQDRFAGDPFTNTCDTTTG
jgi:pimeloyl-ACP methyl ester carboxylesterase